MAPFPIYNPFMISSAALSSTWAIYSIGAGVASLVVIVSLLEGDADDEAISSAAEKWREANGYLKQLKDDFPVDAVPSVESWNGTNDRKAFDAVTDKILAELDSMTKVFESNAKSLDEAKKFFDLATPLILTMVVTATGILIALMALKATAFGAPAAEGAQTATGWATAAAVAGIIVSIIGLLWSFQSYQDQSAKVKFDTDAGKGERGGDINFDEISIDWGTSEKGAKPS